MSTQSRKLFKILKSSLKEGLNIFGAREVFLFDFASLSGVWKFENYLTWLGPHVSGLFPFDCPGRLPDPTRHPYFRWLCSPCRERSAATGCRSSPPHVGWYPLIIAPDVTEEAAAHSAFPLPPFSRTPRYSAMHWPSLRPPSPVTDEPPLSCPTGPKGAPRRRAPPAPRAYPQRRLAKPGHGISPAVIFLGEHLTGGSFLRLFPHPADLAPSSAPPKFISNLISVIKL
jgi:hypothetical protein